MEEKNIWLIRESEHNVGSINIGPGGMMVSSSRIAWGGEYEQEVRKSSWQSMMREIEIMEELLLLVITRTVTMELSGPGSGQDKFTVVQETKKPWYG